MGKALLPALVARGHELAGMVRSAAGAELVVRLGARPLIADALDSEAVFDAIRVFRPDAVTHQLTALPSAADLRQFSRVFEQTNRLRREGLNILLAASRAVGIRRFVAQSYCGWPFERQGGAIKTEDDRLDPNPPAQMASTLDALRHVERTMEAARDVGGAALRYGAFYGPGTAISQDGALVAQVRRRRVPVIGDGGGIWSFIHVDDAARATIAALEGDAPGVFNVVDDEPAPVADWLPALARFAGAREPFRLPGWLGRLLLPDHLYMMMTTARGGSNEKIKRTFGWRPCFASWRQGFAHGL